MQMRANLVPIHKKNEKNLKSNYRPVSLLSSFGKMLETCLRLLILTSCFM